MHDTEACVQIGKVTGTARARAMMILNKNMLDKMVPILATLKATLEEAMHPLQRDTLNCLVRLYTEHQPDMEELLGTRSQLAAEIKYNAQVCHSAVPFIVNSTCCRKSARTTASRMLQLINLKQLTCLTSS